LVITLASRLTGRLALTALALATVLAGSSARASIVSVSGNGDIISPTLGGTLANFFQDTGSSPKIHGWDEAQHVTLGSDLYVDINTSGIFDSNGDLAGFQAAKIAAGTVVDSHYLYFDPEAERSVRDVTFTFSGVILGVIVESDRFYTRARGFTDYFLLSDFLRNPLTPAANYATAHFNNRGLEMGSPHDSLAVSISGKTVTIRDFLASSPGDQVRVLTASVPEPSTLLGFGIPMTLLGLAHLRRSRPRV
jgi:hypothetical protein